MNISQLFDLQGKTAIVTGGAGHLGSAISEGLLQAGADVFIASRNEVRCMELAKTLKEKTGGNCYGICLDIGNEDKIKQCFADIYKTTAHIDILVNNASYGQAGKVEQITEKDWQEGIDGTINGVFRCTKQVLPYMIRQKNGVLINIASMYGVVSPDPAIYGDSGFDNPANYGAGKAAIIQFTRYLACHYGRWSIRANSVSPGAFPDNNVQKNDAFIEELSAKNPLKRIGRPDELKGVIVFLASQASSYLTGQNICVDGGWTAW